ncbi:MAG: oligosaccharide flippase family protein, partial [Pseudonocardiaceae bacterium]
MSLRERILQGGAYLAGREVIGMVVRLGGVLALTRLLAPADFGLYAGPAALATFLGLVAQWGTEIFLIRREDEPSQRLYDETFTFLVATTAVVTLGALLISYLVEWVAGPSPLLDPFRVLLLAVPLNALWAPAQARIERAFRFREMAVLELGGDVVLYVASVGLVLAGAGLWGPVAGYVTWQLFLLVASYRYARLVPHLHVSGERLRELLRFGFSYSAADWLQRGKEVVNPLVVGPLLGAAAVGHVALALRLAETLSFVTRATWRISVAALGQIQSDADRLRRALEEGMTLQLLASGTVFAVFALVAHWAVPVVFGQEWSAALDVFPFLAAAYVLTAAFSLHTSLLYVLRRNERVAAVNAARLVMLVALCAALAPVAGVQAFGVALLGSQVGCFLLDREVRMVLDYRFRRAVPWLMAFLPPVFVPFVGLPAGLLLWLPAALVCLAPLPRTTLAGYARTARGVVLRA